VGCRLKIVSSYVKKSIVGPVSGRAQHLRLAIMPSRTTLAWLYKTLCPVMQEFITLIGLFSCSPKTSCHEASHPGVTDEPNSMSVDRGIHNLITVSLAKAAIRRLRLIHGHRFGCARKLQPTEWKSELANDNNRILCSVTRTYRS
jgi:hypothetical protein